jgi:hypothetical protein
VLRVLIRRAFGINDQRYAKAVQHVDELLAQSESWLADQRRSLLGGEELNFSDFSFAAINGLWLLPPGYGGGKADSVRIDSQLVSPAMRADIESWKSRFPLSAAYITKLFRDERMQHPSNPGFAQQNPESN